MANDQTAEAAITAAYNAVTGQDGPWDPDLTLAALRKLWATAHAAGGAEALHGASCVLRDFHSEYEADEISSGERRPAAPAGDDATRARLREAADRMSPLSQKKPTSLDLALVRDAAYQLSELPALDTAALRIKISEALAHWRSGDAAEKWEAEMYLDAADVLLPIICGAMRGIPHCA